MNESFRAEVKSAENLMKAGAICGGISLIIGGVLLSGAGIICAAIGKRRFEKAYATAPDNPGLKDQMERLFKTSLAVAVIAFVLNMITVILFGPLLIEALQSGDVTSLYSALGSGAGSSAATGSSTWG